METAAPAPRREASRIAVEDARGARLQLLPGMHQRFPLLLATRCRPSQTLATSRHSTAPPLGARWPSSRAGNTRVLLTTSRSPARSSGREDRRCGDARPRRSSRDRQQQRERAARPTAAPARSARGQIEVEVADEHRADVACRDRSGRGPRAAASRGRRAASAAPARSHA